MVALLCLWSSHSAVRCCPNKPAFFHYQENSWAELQLRGLPASVSPKRLAIVTIFEFSHSIELHLWALHGPCLTGARTAALISLNLCLMFNWRTFIVSQTVNSQIPDLIFRAYIDYLKKVAFLQPHAHCLLLIAVGMVSFSQPCRCLFPLRVLFLTIHSLRSIFSFMLSQKRVLFPCFLGGKTLFTLDTMVAGHLEEI